MSDGQKLNEATVGALPVPERGNRVYYFSGAMLARKTAPPGFGVRVTTNGTRSFILNYRHRGRECRYTIGQSPTWSALAAVTKAIELRRAIDSGNNPLDERTVARDALTFDGLIEGWAALHLSARRPRYAAEAIRAIRYAFPQLLKRPAADITRADAVNGLDKLVKNGKPAMAGRTLAYARAAFAWAMKRDKVAGNPFAGLPIGAGASERERVLKDDELGALWSASGTLNWPWGPFFRLLVLTLQRREMVAGLRWSEVDLDRALWTIPGARTKNGKPHDVHLSPAALDVLRSLPPSLGRDIVFSTTGKTAISGFSRAKTALDATIRVAGWTLAEWRLHDLRRTGVTTLARLGFDSIVADKLLAHQPSRLRGVAGIYQRHDFACERAAALDAWAVHVTSAAFDTSVVSKRTDTV